MPKVRANREWGRSVRMPTSWLYVVCGLEAVDRSLGEIVPRLLKRFSSREGYKLFDDTLPTRTCPTIPAHCAHL